MKASCMPCHDGRCDATAYLSEIVTQPGACIWIHSCRGEPRSDVVEQIPMQRAEPASAKAQRFQQQCAKTGKVKLPEAAYRPPNKEPRSVKGSKSCRIQCRAANKTATTTTAVAVCICFARHGRSKPRKTTCTASLVSAVWPDAALLACQLASPQQKIKSRWQPAACLLMHKMKLPRVTLCCQAACGWQVHYLD